MHEQSLVRSLLKQVDMIRREHGGGQVTEVRVEVGPLAGVEPLLLATAFEQLAVHDSLTKARLVTEEVGLSVECQRCGLERDVEDFDFRCQDCGGNVRILRGDEFQLVSVSLECTETEQEVAP